MRQPRRALRLADAVLLLLLFLLPWMLIVGTAEGTAARPGLLFWLLLLLPWLILPLIWAARERSETPDALRAAAAEAEQQAAAQARTLAEAAGDVLSVERNYAYAGVPAIEGRLRIDAAATLARLEPVFRREGRIPLLESAGRNLVRVLALPAALDAATRRRSSPWINMALFAATIVTTVFAGALHRGVNLWNDPSQFAAGIPYAAALLGILGVHEMGHFVAARIHGVDVTWPYFIPVPMGLGTLGAFIQIKELIKSRRALFDIGIAGPLAGLAVALPALYFGLQATQPGPRDAAQGMHAGMSVLFALIYQLGHGGSLAEAAGAVVQLSPLALAGWIGLVVTALNLLPVGQLDGGHIAYALFGRRYARVVSIVTVLLMFAFALTVWPGLLMWALIVTLVAGFSHMPALDDVTAPDAKRYALGVLALALLVLIVTPLPGAIRGLMLDSPYL
jgi:Zn-dependent protease